MSQYLRMCSEDHPEYVGKEAVCRDFAAHHSTEYLRRHGIGRINKRHMRRQVSAGVSADYKAFRQDPKVYEGSPKLLEETYRGSFVARGFILSLISAVFINILAKKISAYILKKWQEA